jgi:DNA mismatch endonuclease (patch repair protein)
MGDILTPLERSERMRLIRSQDTKPEMAVRRLLFRLGYRYRLHSRKLPGHPDIVFQTKRKLIFVHGCFWHGHKSCRLTRLPKSKLVYWKPKLDNNTRRDSRVQRQLRKDGWGVLVVWECQLGDLERIASRLRRFLD